MRGFIWEDAEDGREVALVAVCGCGVVHGCKANFLVCPKCRERGVTCGDRPGYFATFAMYRPARAGFAEKYEEYAAEMARKKELERSCFGDGRLTESPTTGITERRCNRCGEWWPLTDYHFANPGCRSRVCNGCRSEPASRGTACATCANSATCRPSGSPDSTKY